MQSRHRETRRCGRGRPSWLECEPSWHRAINTALREAQDTITQLRGGWGLVDFGSSDFKREYEACEFQDKLPSAVRAIVFD